jgi:ribosomal protein S18 acetylase RimI-like enzyme
MEAHQTSPITAATAGPLQGAAVLPCLTVRTARWRDQFAICGIECACFGRMRLPFGLWARVGGSGVETWIAEAGIEAANGKQSGLRAAGYLIAYQWPLDGRPLTYIGGVGVKPAYRQQGIGEQLTRKVLDAGDTVWLHVRDHNRSAIQLYDKLGFHVAKQLSHFYSNGDNALVMLRDVARR